MALFAISDLHLPLGVDKPMDIFGVGWKNYVQRLYDNWQSTVLPDDIVVLPGDFSWATYIEDARKDFEFLHSLNGKKILLKGNHDYWWTTMRQMEKFISEAGFFDISFLHNNSFIYKNEAIFGTRGWSLPMSAQFAGDDEKIYKREVNRLEISLKSSNADMEKTVFMHYPPIAPFSKENEFTELFEKYNVKRCVFGHLHASGVKNALLGKHNSVEYLLVSCDYLKFMPLKLSE